MKVESGQFVRCGDGRRRLYCIGRAYVLLSLVSSCAALTAGCLPAEKSAELIQLERQVGQLAYENESLGRDLAERDARIAGLRERVAELQDAPTDVLTRLFTVERLKIASLTGGADYDGEPGDDGITVYVTPLDRDGDPIKAAGEIEVFLYDLTNPGDPRELGHYVVNEPRRLSKAWYGGWMTNHYTVKCEWPPGKEPPASREVQIRVTFLDWLTGDKFSAMTTVRVAWVDRD